MSKQYLYRVSILNRKNSHPLEAISYYSGQEQRDNSAHKVYNSNTTDNVIWNNIATPTKKDAYLYNQLPQYIKFRVPKKDLIDNARNILWKNVFQRETRDDAQFARLFEVSMPAFLTKQEAINAVSDFANILVQEGMIADVSVHSRQKDLTYNFKKGLTTKESNIDEKNEGSLDYTGYLMCTLRKYENGIFVNKNREWNDIKKIELWRRKWVEILARTIDNANVSQENKKSWEEKMTIYSEYEEIKNKLIKEKQMGMEESNPVKERQKALPF